MTPREIATDYLVKGAGAMGLAFADEIVRFQPKATVTLVDRRPKPGGHWLDAYPFVRLHQPASAYGVNSLPLGYGGDHLSTKPELLAYFERVLDRLTATGRVRFLGLHELDADNTARALADPEQAVQINVRKRVVDAAYMDVQVPATHPPRYAVDPQARVIPPNGLVSLRIAAGQYVVIGGGKTGIDAVLFLLAHGVAASKIRWIVPNDMWLWNRERVQPGRTVARELLGQARVIAESQHAQEIFQRLESTGSVMRLDPSIQPSKWRCATVSPQELAQLQTVQDVVRAGRVQSVTADGLALDDGELRCGPDPLYIDCTANPLSARPVTSFFSPGRITLQNVVLCQQVFSAAALARLESVDKDDDWKNALWTPVPHPELAEHLAPRLSRSMDNIVRGHMKFPLWFFRSRVNVMSPAPLPAYLISAWRALRVVPRAVESAERMANA